MKRYKTMIGALVLTIAYSTQAFSFQFPNILNRVSRWTTGHTYGAYREAGRLVREYRCDLNKKETAIIEISEIADGDGFFGISQAEIRWNDLCGELVRTQEGGDLEKKAEEPSGGSQIGGPGGAPEGPSFNGPSGGYGGSQSGGPGGKP